jgi:hypothetical protein
MLRDFRVFYGRNIGRMATPKCVTVCLPFFKRLLASFSDVAFSNLFHLDHLEKAVELVSLGP